MPHHPARPVSPCGSSRTPSTRRSPEPECAARARWSSCRPRTGRPARRPEVSLQVVELLPELLELAFHCDDGLRDRKSTRLNSSHGYISYAVFCLKKKKKTKNTLSKVISRTSQM